MIIFLVEKMIFLIQLYGNYTGILMANTLLGIKEPTSMLELMNKELLFYGGLSMSTIFCKLTGMKLEVMNYLQLYFYEINIKI